MKFQISSLLVEHAWTFFVGLILVVWLVASIIHQFRFSWWFNIARFDLFNLLPRWSFFAPNPGRHDFHIVYRNWIDKQPGPWMELVTTKMDRYRWIWHPSRYCSKAISDLVSGLYSTIHLNKDNPTIVMFSSSYISLLQLVMNQSFEDLNVSHRQFAIVVSQKFQERELEIKYISKIHRAKS